MSKRFRILPLLAFPLLSACVYMPTGPSMLVLPGTGKSFDQFRTDDYNCRQFALGQLGGITPGQAAISSGAGSALAGAALGAATGAILGGGRGAAAGAVSGLAMGGMAGAGAAQVSGYEAQQRYDTSYLQCMYAQGHRVPVSGHFVDELPSSANTRSNLPPPPLPPAGEPPLPPGSPE